MRKSAITAIAVLTALTPVATVAASPIAFNVPTYSASTDVIPVQTRRWKRSGREQLRRLFADHFHRIPITRAAKAATGDPNIAVYDTRGGPDQGPFRCTYFNVRGKRALLCD